MPPPPQQLTWPFLTSRVRMAIEAVHLAAHVEVEQAAAVDAASARFQFVDDLHGANLRRAGDRAAGEAAFQQVEGVLPGASSPVTLLTR